MHSQYSIDLRSLFLCIDCLTNLLLQVKHSRIGTHLHGHIGLHRMPSCGFVDFLYPHKVPWFIIGSSLDKNGLVYTTIPCVYIYIYMLLYIYILLYIINYICHIYIPQFSTRPWRAGAPHAPLPPGILEATSHLRPVVPSQNSKETSWEFANFIKLLPKTIVLQVYSGMG